jgi:hypothetical protein
MAKVRTEHKETLLAQGKWAEFVVRRDELKAEGMKASEANRLAVLEFLGEEAAEIAGENRSRSSSLKRQKPAGAVVSSPQRNKTTTSPVKESVVNDTAPAASPLGLLSSEIADRIASGPEIIMWIVRNMELESVKASDCPDPAAWTFLNQCRSNALFKQNFLLQVGFRHLLKQEGSGGQEDLAGIRVEETIDKLLELRGISVAEDRVHCPVAAGSIPAPATIPVGA